MHSEKLKRNYPKEFQILTPHVVLEYNDVVVVPKWLTKWPIFSAKLL